MPAILVLLCVLMVLGIGSSLLVGAWISAGLQAVLLVGVITGKEGARKLLILLSIISAGVLSTFILVPLVGMFDRIFIQKGPFRPDPLDGLVVVMTYALVPSLFTVFVLTRRHVQSWMYARSMGNLEGVSSKRPDEVREANAAAVSSAAKPLFVTAGLLLCSGIGLYTYAYTIDLVANETEQLLSGERSTSCGVRPNPDEPDQWGRFTQRARLEKELTAWQRCMERLYGAPEDPAATRARASSFRLGALGLAVVAVAAVGAGILRRRAVAARLEAPPSVSAGG